MNKHDKTTGIPAGKIVANIRVPRAYKPIMRAPIKSTVARAKEKDRWVVAGVEHRGISPIRLVMNS